MAEIAVVVEDAVVDSCKAPAGVRVVGASRYRSKEFGANVFQMGNNLTFHGYMIGPVLRLGGALVLHDLSLYDLFWAMCNGPGTYVRLRKSLSTIPLANWMTEKLQTLCAEYQMSTDCVLRFYVGSSRRAS